MISWYYPPDGAIIESTTFAISWNDINGANAYRFQMDDSIDFSSVYTDTNLTEPSFIPVNPVPPGIYYWRVKAIMDTLESPWSGSKSVQSIAMPEAIPGSSDLPDGTVALKSIPVRFQEQQKDTDMVCLDGDTETGPTAWDTPQYDRSAHSAVYCSRAVISMMASYYGGELSQDRISYEIFHKGSPEGELGHNQRVYVDQVERAINWALGMEIPLVIGKPSFQEIKDWIDANQPVYTTVPGHARLLIGYHEYVQDNTTFQLIQLLDPATQMRWVAYDHDNIKRYWVGPSGTGGAPNVKSDEDVDSDQMPDTFDDFGP